MNHHGVSAYPVAPLSAFSKINSNCYEVRYTLDTNNNNDGSSSYLGLPWNNNNNTIPLSTMGLRTNTINEVPLLHPSLIQTPVLSHHLKPNNNTSSSEELRILGLKRKCNSTNGPTITSSGSASKRQRKVEKVPRCTHCGISYSPEWRKGPLGRNTLCNACGLQYAKNVKKGTAKEQGEKLKLGYIVHPYNKEATLTDIRWYKPKPDLHGKDKKIVFEATISAIKFQKEAADHQLDS